MEEAIGSNPICSTNSRWVTIGCGALAHLVERDIRIVEASGSSPLRSTMELLMTDRQLQPDWSAYFDATRYGAHFRLLDLAIECCGGDKKFALDLGAGALRNTRYLLNNSFVVDAVDSSPLFAGEVNKLNNPLVRPYTVAFDTFTYKKDYYGLIVAQNALTFNPPATFCKVIQNIKESIAPGGVFCANFSGKNDEWAVDSAKSFTTLADIRAFFAGMNIMLCEEWERDTVMAVGGTRHTHNIDVIVQRPL